MRIKTFLFLLMLAPVAAAAQTVETLRLDPDNAMGGSVSQLFDAVEYIPLQTTKESLFGRVDKLIVTREYYFVHDRTTDQILLFKKDGKYFSKVQMQRYVKTSTPDMFGINTFAVDEYNKWIIVNHLSRQGSIYIFNYAALSVILKEMRDKQVML
jgi:hypothetical protein